MKIKLYTSDDKNTWDEFVRNSKNGTFLFYRDFIEYHGDRFNDYSLMFFVDDTLIALMPGHMSDKVYYSHQGLTYGGLIMSKETTAKQVLEIFEYLTITFRHQGIRKIIYRSIPHIYHKQPAEEDLYTLFRYNAVLSARSISSTIQIGNRLKYSDSRKNGLKKAIKNDLKAGISTDLETFWNILSHNLKERYGTDPVHSLKEISYLQEKFPDNIHLFAACDSEGVMLGGCLVFEMEEIVHAQYTAATEEGKAKGVIDLIIDYLIDTEYTEKRYFDYGVSTENQGLYLNETLIYQKEGFGARGIVYDTYTINL